MLNQDKQIGGEPVHVRDCYVWAEVYYLDSRTDYREYLPHASSSMNLSCWTLRARALISAR